MEADSITPLIVITGPTASGKTSLALTLAQKFKGEIICADSRTVYKNMDIGTAKPTIAEQQMVPHWGIDLLEPGGVFTAADFKQYAEQKINEIRERGNVPFLVGGTGLYIDSVLFDYQFGGSANYSLRRTLEQLDIDALHKYCSENNITLPENMKNKRYIIRAIEQKSINTKRRDMPIHNTIIVGIATNREKLRARIAERVEQLFTNNVVDEAIKLGKKYGWDNEAMTGNVYRLIKKYIDGDMTLSQVKEKNVISDWHLAKRQVTWLKRDKYIRWLSLEDAEHYLSDILAEHARS